MILLNKDFALFFILTFLIFIEKISSQMNTITTSQVLNDGETMVSSDGSFELGFFSPGNSKNRYVGIWFKNIPVITVVWVANRDVPLTNTTGVLKVGRPGILLILNDTNGGVIWSSNTSRHLKAPVAKLLNSGNLVVKDANDDEQGNLVWQSFNYPTDTLLPGMKLGWNLITGLEVYLSSWKSNDDPSSGEYTYHCDPTGYPQIILKKGSTELFRVVPWNGHHFSGTPQSTMNQDHQLGLVINHDEVYYSYERSNRSTISRFTLNQNGAGQHWAWEGRTRGWAAVYQATPTDSCDFYKQCGAYSSCNASNSSPVCRCLERFAPKDQNGWVRGDWSDGCVRKTPLNCENIDGFRKYSGVKLPDTKYSWSNETMTLKECGEACLKNCSCTAYTNLDVSSGGGIGCLIWFGDLIDIKEIPVGPDIYIRLASSELESKTRKREILVVSLSSLMGMVLLGLTLILYLRRRKKGINKLRGGNFRQSFADYDNDESSKDIELPLFDLQTVIKATDNFSFNNKLGQGGYGPVYKGVMEDGREIAVKRLSRTSLQGLAEFKNEVICIAKLQHRNLVKLLGCCIQGEEKMLIYEYMPNKSLDLILFDPMQSQVLDWPKRFHIIHGIARGIMYLHQDSRLRIIHRDLKTSNILLDSDMNPKISDFGMARSFRGNEIGANTSRVVGTYGYMSPEYTIDGLFSVKSDVFSFGVIVLEIVSGKRNRGFAHIDHHHNLLGHAWTLYKEGRSLELAETYLGLSGYVSEVLRLIHVGLLCVQQYPEERPSMSEVVIMLGNDSMLPQARHPGFFAERSLFAAESSGKTDTASSLNQVTITLMEAR